MILFMSCCAITSCDKEHSGMENIFCEPRGAYWRCVDANSKVQFEVPYDKVLLARGPICTWSAEGFADIKEHHKDLHLEIDSLKDELGRQ